MEPVYLSRTQEKDHYAGRVDEPLLECQEGIWPHVTAELLGIEEPGVGLLYAGPRAALAGAGPYVERETLEGYLYFPSWLLTRLRRKISNQW